jgi:hypothetical protein
MRNKLIAATAFLMFGALAPAAFAASGSDGLAGSSPANGTVAVEGGSMRNPGNVWVPSAVPPSSVTTPSALTTPSRVQDSDQSGSSGELQTKDQGYGTDYQPLEGEHNHHR